ncbi:pilin N-terminal domain-containing protein [Enterococcus sp. AZ196]|uniref:pilin N-terminal domain-containing protein n=1 Tax=Enterococcus sp. AZ196 TaxID=2774659 RepID=UPI003D2E2E55
MKFNKFLGAVLLLSVAILSNTTVLAADSDTSDSSSIPSTSTSASTSTSVSTSAEEGGNSQSSEKVSEEDFQEPILFKQTIHIQKVVSKEKITNNGKFIRDFEGVNGAHFKIYDVTEILKEVSGGKTGLDQSNIEKITTDVTERSKKLSEDQLKLVTEGDTKTVDGVDGVFEYTVETNLLTSNAYYAVNSDSPESATTSEPFVFITPICDEDGNPMENIWYYPKSDPISNDPKKTNGQNSEQDAEKEVKKVVSTGVKRDFLETIIQTVVNLFDSKG